MWQMGRWPATLMVVALLEVLNPVTPTAVLADDLLLTPSLPSSQPVGTTIVWTATAADPTPLVYQFSIGHPGGPFLVLRDFSPASSFSWTPMEEGAVVVKVVAKPGFGSSGTTEAESPFVVISRLSSARAMVTATDHPLVALYNAPPCSVGYMYVEFGPVGGQLWQRTSPKPCRPGEGMNFYLAGMRASITHQMRHVTVSGLSVERGSLILFTTGALPLDFPSLTVLDPLDPETSVFDGILLHSMLALTQLQYNFPFATDLAGRVLWYHDKALPSTGILAYVTRPVPGGTLLVLAACCGSYHVLGEIDVAGHTLRETNIWRINEQLVARGEETIRSFHHEAVRFPNGHTLILGLVERPGADGAPPIMGDMVIALDTNWQVVWTWNAFDHLDASRQAVLAESCLVAYGLACPASSPLAQDWLHSNSIAYSPQDGNLILSMRHQDWVIKIDYRNGTGSGAVLWRLGQGGDFTLFSADPSPWFSHQHDASYVEPNQIIVFDNGNTRCQGAAGPCSSRGQVLDIDEDRHMATLRVNADLQGYSERLGSAQQLSNGNFHFASGDLAVGAQSIEITPDGNPTFIEQTGADMYRSFRMKSLYRGAR